VLWFVDGSGGENHFRTSCSIWFPAGKFQFTTQAMEVTDYQHVISSILFVIATLAFLASGRTKVQLKVEGPEGRAPYLCSTVAFIVRAMAIRTTSWIRLSNLFSPSSISLLPRSFLKYIPDRIWESSSFKCDANLTEITHLLAFASPPSSRWRG
jgi:hypothetical protein